jgi:hypothetical protein
VLAAAADALARGAKALEDKAPAEASALYGEALEQYESDGKEAQATDVFRQAIALLVKRQVGVYSFEQQLLFSHVLQQLQHAKAAETAAGLQGLSWSRPGACFLAIQQLQLEALEQN